MMVLLVGRVLAVLEIRYWVEEEVGEWGDGIDYLAHDVSVQLCVCVCVGCIF